MARSRTVFRFLSKFSFSCEYSTYRVQRLKHKESYVLFGFSCVESEWNPGYAAAGIRCVTGFKMIRDALEQGFVKLSISSSNADVQARTLFHSLCKGR